MKAARRNIEITRGDDYSHQIEFTLDGEAVDKSGCSYMAQCRPSALSADELAVDFAVDDSQLADGILVLSLAPAVTRLLPGVGVWDLQQTSPAVTTVMAGAVVVNEDVTR